VTIYSIGAQAIGKLQHPIHVIARVVTIADENLDYDASSETLRVIALLQ
jgi:hypothetical protein